MDKTKIKKDLTNFSKEYALMLDDEDIEKLTDYIMTTYELGKRDGNK